MENSTVSRPVTLRNVSRRPLDVSIEPGTADAADIVVDVRPRVARLRPGASVEITVEATVPLLPRAPAALGGALRVKVRNGATLRVPWTIAVPLAKRDLIPSARLSSRNFEPSDVDPAVLTVIAGRVDGSAERPQLLAPRGVDHRPLPGRPASRPSRARARLAAGSVLVRYHWTWGGWQAPATRRVRAASHCRSGRRRRDRRGDGSVRNLVVTELLPIPTSRRCNLAPVPGMSRPLVAAAVRGARHRRWSTPRYSRGVVSEGVHA